MTCKRYDDLARYETGALSMSDADALDKHVATCADCNAERMLLRKTLADLGAPAGASEPFVDRVISSIRAETPVRRAPQRIVRLRPWLLAAAGLVLVGGISHQALKVEGTLQARGGGAQTLPPAHAGMLMFRAARLQPIPSTGLAPDVAFAVTTTNKTSETHYLLAFGLDARGEVHWLYPAYPEGAAPPSSVPVPAGTAEDHMLEEFVTPQAVAAGPFPLVTVMAKQPTNVRDVEALLARHKPEEPLSSLFPSAAVREWRSHWSATPKSNRSFL